MEDLKVAKSQEKLSAASDPRKSFLFYILGTATKVRPKTKPLKPSERLRFYCCGFWSLLLSSDRLHKLGSGCCTALRAFVVIKSKRKSVYLVIKRFESREDLGFWLFSFCLSLFLLLSVACPSTGPFRRWNSANVYFDKLCSLGQTELNGEKV